MVVFTLSMRLTRVRHMDNGAMSCRRRSFSSDMHARSMLHDGMDFHLKVAIGLILVIPVRASDDFKGW